LYLPRVIGFLLTGVLLRIVPGVLEQRDVLKALPGGGSQDDEH
jgi:hypothetical protein